MRTARNWNQPCPNPNCDHYGLINRGNIIAIATYLTASGSRRIFRCKQCGQQFSETRDTVFFDLRKPEEKVMMALKMLLVKMELHAITFVLGVTEETILTWLDRAAKKAAEINAHLLRNLPVTQIQLDEMWTFIRRKCAGDENDAVTTAGDEGKQWVWISYAPEFRLMLAVLTGPRTFECALALIQMTASMVCGVPCFFSDGFSCYLPALIEVYHRIKNFDRTGRRGRPRKPVVEPHPDLVYGQLIKIKAKGRLKSLKERVLCGADRLGRLGLKISTSLLERLNLTVRHSLAPLTRKCLGFCKNRDLLQKRLVFFQVFYNVARPHQSLRLLLERNQMEGSKLFQGRWIQRTPGMAAGITDHVWSFKELLTAKFEPILNQSISG